LKDWNKDGIISGEELTSIEVWIDANSNLKVDKKELFSLDHFGIVTLNTKDDTHFQSYATLNDGTIMLTEDLSFY